MYRKENDAYQENKMARKYAQTRKDREDESRGMERYEERKGSFIEGRDPSIGRGSFANMPEEKISAAYPRARMRKGGYLDDSMVDIDDLQMDSDEQVSRHLSNQK